MDRPRSLPATFTLDEDAIRVALEEYVARKTLTGLYWIDIDFRGTPGDLSARITLSDRTEARGGS
jgi:hypothetical protein